MRTNDLDLTRAAFLQAILDDPEDDTVRLIYADFEEEHGDAARAELIRVQMELAQRRENPYPQPTLTEYEPTKQAWYRWNATTDTLLHRARELLAKYARRWIKGLPPGWISWGTGAFGHARSSIYYTFRRGFIEVVDLPIEDWLKHAAVIVGAAPVRKVQLTDKRPIEEDRTTYEWWTAERADYDGYDPESDLPNEIYLLLTGKERDLLGYRMYDTPELAIADLSAACIRYSRDKLKEQRNACSTST